MPATTLITVPQLARLIGLPTSPAIIDGTTGGIIAEGLCIVPGQHGARRLLPYHNAGLIWPRCKLLARNCALLVAQQSAANRTGYRPDPTTRPGGPSLAC